MRTKGEESNVETISFDEMSTLDVPSAALRSSLDKIASALQKVGAAGTDASAAVDELRTSLRAAAAQSVKSARSLAKFDEINRLSAPAAEKADAEKTTAAAKKTGGSTRKSGSRSGSRAKAEADGEVSIWQAALQTLRDAWDGFWLYLQTYYGPAIAAWQAAWEQIKQTALAVWEPVRAAALDLWNGALQPLADYLLTVFLPGVANSFSQAFAPILGGTISAAMTILGNLFVWLCGLIGEHHGRVAGLWAADPGRVGAGVSGLDRPADRPVAKCAAARFNGPDFADRHPVERAFAAPVAAADHGAGRCDESGADRVEHRADAAGCLAGQHAGPGRGASV